MASSDPSSVSFSRSSSIGSDGWEFVDWARKSGKELFFKELHFDENVILEMDYFDCPACTPRGPTKAGAAGEKLPCTCNGRYTPSARSPGIPLALLDRAPSLKFVADQDSVSQILFSKSDQENRFVRMTMVSPRTPGSKGSSEPLKENNFYNVSLISPRTPGSPKIPNHHPVEPDQIAKEKKLTRTASRRPPKSLSSKWMAVPEELETINENMNYGSSGIFSPRSPDHLHPLGENVSLSESMISPKTQTGLGIIDTKTKLESEPEDTFPGFPPTIEGAMKSDFEPEQMMDTANYVGFGVLSPRPVVIEGLSPVCVARDEEEEAAEEDEMGVKIMQVVLPEEESEVAEAKDHVDDQKKKVVNERGQNKLGGIGALASIGVAAAATVAVLVLGGGNQARARSRDISTGGSSRKKRF